MKGIRYKKSVANYFIVLGDIISTLFNHLVFFSYNGNQSFSARCFEHRNHWFFGTMRLIIDRLISRYEKDHCEASFIIEGKRGAFTSRAVEEYLSSDEYKQRKKKRHV